MQISILMVRALVGAVERAGGHRDRFFRAAELDPALIEDANVWLELAQYLRAIDAAFAESGDPAFGLHMGEHANTAMFDVLGPLAAHAATLREGVAIMTRYSRLVTEGFAPELHESDTHASIRVPGLIGDGVAVRMTAEFALTALVGMLRQFAGHNRKPARVSFAYPAPAYCDEYSRIFEGAACFDQAQTEVVFPRAWLDTPQLYQSPDLHSHLKLQADRALDRIERDVSYATRVETLLTAHSPRQLTMDEVARELGSSRRSLNRRLAAEGTSYGELVSRARVHAAKRMLQSRETSIQEAAYALGFSEAAAFHRAFKRWTGMTPKQYRATF